MTTKGATMLKAVHTSLASQPANASKGFDVTRIDTIDPAIIENLVSTTDLSALGPQQRAEFIKMLCESLGLNPLSQPLKIMAFKDKETAGAKEKHQVYATKDCAEQLRKIHGVSVDKLDAETIGKTRMVTAYVSDRIGRTDVSIGAVALEAYYNNTWVDLRGQSLANAIMKAETKAKRRATLSICGLGFLDETEVSDMENVKLIETPLPEEKPEATEAPNEAAEAIKTEKPITNTAKDFSDCVKAIHEATTREELSNINEMYGAAFTTEINNKVKDLLNNRLAAIKKPADQLKAAGAGLYQKSV